MRSGARKVLCIAGLGLCAATAARAQEDGDAMLWTKLVVAGTLAEGAAVRLEEESRFCEDWGTYYDQRLLVQGERAFADWFSAALGLQQVFARTDRTVYTSKTVAGETTYARAADHYWTSEQIPMLDLVARAKPAGWGLEDRIRVEYRMKEDTDEFFRYRNRVKVRAPWSWTRGQANPFAAWEAFYSDRDTDPGWDQHRFQAGLAARLSKSIGLDVYYMRQRVQKGGVWSDYDVTGVEVSIRIPRRAGDGG